MKKKRSQWTRWGVFNGVGLLGFGVQLLALFLLKRVVGLDYRLATACGVEIALLHNFVWHEHVTWADVIPRSCGEVWGRMVRFHAANGLISLLGNVAITWTIVTEAKIAYLAANSVSVVICSVLNFAVGDRFVFRGRARDRCRPELWQTAAGRDFT